MALVKIWANRIIAGTKKYSECPEIYKDTEFRTLVKEELQNRVASGEITEEYLATLIEG